LKVNTDIITSIAASPTGRAVILVLMYVEIFKTVIIDFIGDVKMCLKSLTDHFQYQSVLEHVSYELT